MRAVAYAWTTPALLAGAKTVTRRNWQARTRAGIEAGDQCRAWDSNPRNGGIPVAIIEVVRVPYVEAIGEAPDEDYEAEGFAWLDANPEIRRRAMPKIAKQMGVRDARDVSMRLFWDLWRAHERDQYTVLRTRLVRPLIALDEWLEVRAPRVLGS